MFELKKLRKESIESAIRRAERYRLLNEPRQTESICLDVLAVEPEHHAALVLLLLSRTDQFVKDHGSRPPDAREVLAKLTDPYEQQYYHGLICERWAKAQLTRNPPHAGPIAYEWLRQAMDCYELAEPLAPEGNDDTRLRWNACARLINSNARVRPTEDDFQPLLE